MSSSSNKPRRPGKSPSPSPEPDPASPAASASSIQPGDSSLRLVRFGWRALLIYVMLGLALETLHGFKVGWYLDVGYEMRRLMFNLAHAHGALLSLVTIAASLTARSFNLPAPAPSAAGALIGATVLMPLGFFLGGVIIHDGDPGIGILLVPIGALLLIYAVARVARDLGRSRR